MDEWNWRSPLLGELHTLEVPGGELEYWERGSGPVLVFSHGWLSNANLWREVVDDLSADHRCVVLDLPLGAHRRAMNPDAHLTPRGVAGLIAAVVVGLDLHEVSLIGNDSGGAYSQIALAEYSDELDGRVSDLVLTSCETPWDQWPPQPFDTLPVLAQDPDALGTLFGSLRDPAVRALPQAFGLLHKRPLPDEVSDSYALPAASDGGILRDVAAVMVSASSEPVHAAGAALLERSDLPVLLVWSREDSVFPVAHAQAFADKLHDATLEVLDDSFSFTPEDQPGELSAAIRTFVGAR